MFFHITLSKDILMHPSSFGKNLVNEVRKALYKEVEGTVDPYYGYIVQVTDINNIPFGEVREGGLVNFHVTYRAIIFRPFKNEVLEAVATRIDQIGIHFSAGPLKGLVPRSDRSDMDYDPNTSAYVFPDYVLKEGDHLRLRIIAPTFHATDIFVLGTIAEDYLGLI